MRPTLLLLAVCVSLVAAQSSFSTSQGSPTVVDDRMLHADVQPTHIIQEGQHDHLESNCHAELMKLCCKHKEQRCCRRTCGWQTPEMIDGGPEHVVPHIHEKKCKEHEDKNRCCSQTVQSCCTACPRFAETKTEATAQTQTQTETQTQTQSTAEVDLSVEYAGAMVPAVLDVDCPAKKREQTCCSHDKEHLSACCAPKHTCTKVGDMKMGTLKQCTGPTTRCCAHVSDTCCSNCAAPSATHVQFEADLAPLHLPDEPCVHVKRCCTSSVKRCCNECTSPIVSNFAELRSGTKRWTGRQNYANSLTVAIISSNPASREYGGTTPRPRCGMCG